MNVTIQLHWQDRTGEHLFVSSQSGAMQAAITLAIALTSSNSATAVKVIEVTQGDALTFTTKYSMGVWL